MILELADGSSTVARAAASLVLALHVTGGGIGIVSGAVALAARKGGRVHRLAGRWFLGSMLTMSAIGACVAPMLPDRISALAAVFTFYLVVTGWATVQPRAGSIGLFARFSPVVALGIAAIGVVLGTAGANRPAGIIEGQPYELAYAFAFLASLAAVSDVRVLITGGLSGAARLSRHLWRMCTALFIAAGSFFLGQQQVFPPSLRGSVWLMIPEFTIVALLLFWLVWVRFSSRIRALEAARAH